MRSSVHSVLEATGALRAALLAPSLEDVQAALPALQQAIFTLEQLKTASPEASSRSELEALARELQVVSRLAEQGERISRGTLRLLAAAVSGRQACSYQQDGEPTPVHATGIVAVRG